MHLCQRLFQSSKHFLNSISGIAFKAFFDSASIYSIVSKTFWWNGYEERVQSETVHYRDAKTTSCLPKISSETVLSDALEMPIVSARSLIVNRRFMCTNSLIWLTCCSSDGVDGRPGRSKSSTCSLLLWSLCDTYKHFSATWTNYRRPSATFWTFPQLKFQSANKI